VVTKTELDYIFNPKSVAIAGVSSKETTLPSQGQRFLQTLLDYGFKGKIYPLNPKGGEIRGLEVYPNVKDVSEPVDYVISCIPALAAPQLIKDCAAKGVKVVHLFTAGFSETGTEEGRQLEKEICSLARQSGVRLLGPNSAGIYSPKVGLTTRTDFAKESGSVALIAQSGGNFTYTVREGARRGIRFSKAVSYGNAGDINETELLEYLAADSDTRIILAYIEGVRNGRLFMQVLKEAATIKPVVVLKGGITESGIRAAASHTGVLAGTEGVWDNLLRQAGAIRVYSLEELIDMAAAFSYLPFPLGRKVSILGVGGGATVLAADDCTSAGLIVPRFSERIRKRISRLLKEESGTILNNPMDISLEAWKTGFFQVLNLLAEYDAIDLSIVHIPLGLSPYQLSMQHRLWDLLLEDVVRAHRDLAKPVILVLHLPTFVEDYEWILNAQRICYKAGIAVYHSIGNAARAVDRFLSYHERKFAGGQG
jgi:acyl-CoA synthetase (NDP forming)